MTSGISNSVNKILKASFDLQSSALQNIQLQQPDQIQKSFGDFLSEQAQGFVTHAYAVEEKVRGYALGQESIEQVAPMVSEFSLEVEAKTKIVAALSDVLKTLSSIQM